MPVAFPSLVPSGRVFTDGDYPHTQFTSYDRRSIRVRHSNVSTGHRLELSYLGLTESEAAEFLSHYHQQRGSYSAFSIPDDAWTGVTRADYSLADFQWRYIEPPVIDDFPCRPNGGHIYNVQLVLGAALAKGQAVLSGASFSVSLVALETGGIALPGAALAVAAPNYLPGSLILAGVDFVATPSTSWGDSSITPTGASVDSLAKLYEDDLLELF